MLDAVKIMNDKNITKGKFEYIFREYARSLYLYALSFLVSEVDAEDVVQEVFINFWKENTYQKVSVGAVKTYLFRSVKNNCLNRLYKKDLQRDRLDLLSQDIAEEEFLRLNDQLVQEIRQKIEQMSPQTRDIIKAVFFEELKYQEVADRMGISVNTVKTLLKKGMSRLREQYASRIDLFLLFLFDLSSRNQGH